MGIKERIVHAGAQLLLERRVSKLSYASLATKLELSGRALALRLVGMPDIQPATAGSLAISSGSSAGAKAGCTPRWANRC